MKKIFLLSILALNSCKKEIPKIISKEGRIDIIVNQYHNPLEDFEDSNHYKISELNYSDGEMIEIINHPEIPDIIIDKFYIKNSAFTHIDGEDFIFNDDHYFLPLSDKTSGMNFNDVIFQNFDKRQNLSDTIMKGKKYLRFSIKNNNDYSLFYVHPTDTLIPYSLSKIVDSTYNGRLEIIESFNAESIVYATIYLNHYKTLNAEALKIFDYNLFLKQ